MTPSIQICISDGVARFAVRRVMRDAMLFSSKVPHDNFTNSIGALLNTFGRIEQTSSQTYSSLHYLGRSFCQWSFEVFASTAATQVVFISKTHSGCIPLLQTCRLHLHDVNSLSISIWPNPSTATNELTTIPIIR